jgi:glucose/arabinose dehydrogenase
MIKQLLRVIIFSLLLALAACQSGGDEPGQTNTPPVVTRPTETAPTATLSPAPAEVEATSSPAEPQATETPGPTATPVPPTATSSPPEFPVSSISLGLVAEGFTRPLYLTHAFDERLFVVEQAGRILIVAGGQVLAEPFLDISDRVGSEASEQGLLSLAFHPDYTSNGRFFVNYTNKQGNTIVARYQVQTGNLSLADRDSEIILLTIGQPYWNHNGGQLQFGPDGYLYIGMGDGGSAGDPQGNGQNSGTLLGSLLRLDVDGAEPYAIPADNPFVGQESGALEVWAIGLRNPWRFSFDRLTGDLYVADVGQNLWEEINFTPAGSPGGQNYGWSIMEASHCYARENCDSSGLVLPVAEYNHQGGNCSVTGGYVYRGQQFESLRGNYFFADFCMGNIWGLFRQADGTWRQTVVMATSGHVISSFGEDAAGELYVVDHAGAIYQLQP